MGEPTKAELEAVAKTHDKWCKIFFGAECDCHLGAGNSDGLPDKFGTSVARPRMTHKVKCWPEFFQPMLNGRKKFDLRLDDRGYQVGDQLLEQEWEPPEPGKTYFDEDFHYTGRELLVRVDYIVTSHDTAGFGKQNPLPHDYVIMSISLVS